MTNWVLTCHTPPLLTMSKEWSGICLRLRLFRYIDDIKLGGYVVHLPMEIVRRCRRVQRSHAYVTIDSLTAFRPDSIGRTW